MTVETSPAVSDADLANAIRALSMDAVQAANSGHPGMPMGMADTALALFRDHLRFDPKDPQWPDRDRFILSAGHGSMLIYSLLHLTGYDDLPIEELKNFRQLGSKTPGHPEFGHTEGVETTTGPLGQGLANSVGFAIAERHLNAEFGDDLVDHYTYVIAGDGCLMEGISQEAIALAGHLKLNKLIVIWDDNDITIDGRVSLSDSTDQRARFEASGWNTIGVDGHDTDAVSVAIEQAKESDKPTLIAAKTTIGYGSPNRADTSKAHGAPLGPDEIAATREALDWPHEPFVIPEDVKAAWAEIGTNSAKAAAEWRKRHGADAKAADFDARMSGDIPQSALDALDAYKNKVMEEKPKLATRAASGKALEILLPEFPAMLGGSADLTGSNNTKTGIHANLSAENYGGTYVNYGIREHAMASAMNGMALHGGVVPYAGTFLVFADYCRPAIRLSALMGQRVIYVMTHDSIGVGEDGPTHQPVEHIPSLRAIPNLLVFRPCDALDTAECWEIALQQRNRPSVIALSRQGLPHVRMDIENMVQYGGYIHVMPKDENKRRQVTLIASGSECVVAKEAREQLEEMGIATTIVFMTCCELFDEQPYHYREEVLDPTSLRIAIEATNGFGLEKYVGIDGAVISMKGFGASAPGGELFEHFGLTADAVVDAVKARL